MNRARLGGIVLLVVGVVLLMIGISASDSLADQVSDLFTGHFTDATTWYILGGIALAVAGLLLALFGGRRSTV